MTVQEAARLYLTHVLDGAVPSRSGLSALVVAGQTLKAAGLSLNQRVHRPTIERLANPQEPRPGAEETR